MAASIHMNVIGVSWKGYLFISIVKNYVQSALVHQKGKHL
jgi:hypothetical protein